MKRALLIVTLAVVWCCPVWGAGEGGSVPIAPAGLIKFDPPQPLGCVAVRVDVPLDKMVTGVRWHNGTASESFPRILAASGSGFFPPPYSEAMVVADSVQGNEQEWSAVVFATPVASVSGTLFVVMEYPANYESPAGGLGLGVGYADEDAQYAHFVTGDGENWVRVVSKCRVLVEPILADRLPGVVALRAPGSSPVPSADTRLGLFIAPNPFNPETRIDLYLQAATNGTIRILDLRGRLVTELHHGPLVQGENSFVWRGRDQGGRTVASGVYWVLAETGEDRLVKKMLLLK